MTGYYAHFVRNYADLDASLSDLLKKEYTWQWIERDQSAIKGFKTAPTSAPVLVYHDFTRPFSYAMDASDIEISTVL